MHSRWKPLCLFGLTGCLGPGPSPAGADLCDGFYQALADVPHVSLESRVGPFQSIWDGQTHEGCEVEFQTTDAVRGGAAVPDFIPLDGTAFHDMGWRMDNEIGADGPGSGIHGITRESVLCIVRWQQLAYLDDDGEIVQSDSLGISVQCRETEPGPDDY